MANIANLNVVLGARTERLEKGMARGRTAVKGFASGVDSTQGSMKAFLMRAAKMAGAFLAVRAALRQFTAAARDLDSLGKMGDMIGETTERLAALRHGAKIFGSDAETMDKSLVMLAKRLGEVAATGTGESKRALDAINASVGDFLKLSPADQFALLADKVSNLATQEEKAFVASELLGRGGVKLLNFLDEGSKGAAEMEERVRKLGGAFSSIQIDRVEEMNDAFTDLKAAFSNTFKTLLIEAAPVIKFVAQVLTKVMTFLQKAIKLVKKVIEDIVKVITFGKVDDLFGDKKEARERAQKERFVSGQLGDIQSKFKQLADNLDVSGVIDLQDRLRGLIKSFPKGKNLRQTLNVMDAFVSTAMLDMKNSFEKLKEVGDLGGIAQLKSKLESLLKEKPDLESAKSLHKLVTGFLKAEHKAKMELVKDLRLEEISRIRDVLEDQKKKLEDGIATELGTLSVAPLIEGTAEAFSALQEDRRRTLADVLNENSRKEIDVLQKQLDKLNHIEDAIKGIEDPTVALRRERIALKQLEAALGPKGGDGAAAADGIPLPVIPPLDIKVPRVEVDAVKAELKPPELPELRAAKIDVPELPELRAPKMPTMDDLRIGIDAPEIAALKADVPKLRTSIDAPQIDPLRAPILPELRAQKLPQMLARAEFDAPTIDQPDLNVAAPKMPQIASPQFDALSIAKHPGLSVQDPPKLRSELKVGAPAGDGFAGGFANVASERMGKTKPERPQQFRLPNFGNIEFPSRQDENAPQEFSLPNFGKFEMGPGTLDAPGPAVPQGFSLPNFGRFMMGPGNLDVQKPTLDHIEQVDFRKIYDRSLPERATREIPSSRRMPDADMRIASETITKFGPDLSGYDPLKVPELPSADFVEHLRLVEQDQQRGPKVKPWEQPTIKELESLGPPSVEPLTIDQPPVFSAEPLRAPKIEQLEAIDSPTVTTDIPDFIAAEAAKFEGPQFDPLQMTAPKMKGLEVGELGTPIIEPPVVESPRIDQLDAPNISAPKIDQLHPPTIGSVTSPRIDQLRPPVIDSPTVDPPNITQLRPPQVEQLRTPKTPKAPTLDKLQTDLPQIDPIDIKASAESLRLPSEQVEQNAPKIEPRVVVNPLAIKQEKDQQQQAERLGKFHSRRAEVATPFVRQLAGINAPQQGRLAATPIPQMPTLDINENELIGKLSGAMSGLNIKAEKVSSEVIDRQQQTIKELREAGSIVSRTETQPLMEMRESEPVKIDVDTETKPLDDISKSNRETLKQLQAVNRNLERVRDEIRKGEREVHIPLGF